MKEKINHLEREVEAAIKDVKNEKELLDCQNKYFGRKGELAILMQAFGKLPPEQKPAVGKLLNDLKKRLESRFAEKSKKIGMESMSAELEKDRVDVTAPGARYRAGHIHPLSQVQREVEEIFSSMGFSIKDGPEVENEYYNFESLNIPSTHPARDMQDTFFLDKDADPELGKLLMRTQTSPVQIRTMQELGAPLRIIVPGRVFRYEATDASHDSTFYQIEGLLIGEKISLAHLKGVMQEFLSRLFRKEVKVRFRPGYFPFVEPGLEMDFGCLICNQKGCRVCKHSGWVEFMGAGMVHPNVLRAGKIDPKKYCGWAFGVGLTRLVMMRYEISDIRLLFGGDTRFLNQF